VVLAARSIAGTFYRDPADLMMRHWVAEAAPELDHLHGDAAWEGAISNRKIFGVMRE
jgi:hypothetical protein